jgi:hypothetical protein
MNGTSPHPRPAGWLAIGIFLLAGAFMATIAGITLILPGTFLDRMWALNKTGHAGLVSMGKTVGFLFPVLGLALAAAGIGWLKKRYWGWFLAVLLIGGNALGDLPSGSRLVSQPAWLLFSPQCQLAKCTVLHDHIRSVSLSHNDWLVRNRFERIACESGGIKSIAFDSEAHPSPAVMNLSVKREFQAQISILQAPSAIRPCAGPAGRVVFVVVSDDSHFRLLDHLPVRPHLFPRRQCSSEPMGRRGDCIRYGAVPECHHS